MDFSVDDDTALMVEAARRYAQDQLAPHQRQFESARKLPAAIIEQAHAMGFDRACWRDRHGGSGLGWSSRVEILAELATGDAAAAVAINPVGMAYDALLLAGGDGWIERFLNGSFKPGGRVVLLHDEQAQLQGYGAGRISGSLPWVNSDQADLVVLLHEHGVSVLTQGYALEAVPGLALQAAGASRIHFSAAPVAASKDGAQLTPLILARARLFQSSLMLGVLQAASGYARDYAMQRMAFGKPIAHHQALAFLLVDMNSAVEQTRLLIQEAALSVDAGEDAIEPCNQAFIQACEAGHYVGPNAVQVLGASGFMRDYPVEKYMRELTALALGLGGADAARGSLLEHTSLPYPVSFLRHDKELA